MKQMTLAAGRGFDKHARATRKAEFLARMEALVRACPEFCVRAGGSVSIFVCEAR